MTPDKIAVTSMYPDIMTHPVRITASIDRFGEMFGGIFSEPQLFFEPFKGRVELRRLNGMYRKGLVGASQQVQEDSLREKLRRAL